MKYKLFISDFDGTLGSVPDIIQPQTVEAIHKFIAKGGKFVICTGRMFASAKLICQKYGINNAVVSFQGASIDDLETGKVLLRDGISCDLAIKVANELKAEGYKVIADIDDIMFAEDITSWYVEFHKGFTSVVEVSDVTDAIRQKAMPVSKLVVVDQPQVVEKLTEKYSPKYAGKLVFNSGADHLLEIINPNLSKGNAVRFLSKYYNIPLQEVITVGDSTNDVSLISGEWHGVAVGNAKETLKKVAKEVTVPFSEQPIKYLLEKYCL